MQPVHRVRADAGNDVAEVGFGLYAVERCGSDQRVEQRRSFASKIASGEEPVLPAESHGPDSVFDCIVRQFEPAIVDVTGQRRPSRAGVSDGAGEVALARDALQLCIEPGRQLVEPWFCQALANIPPVLGRRAGDQAFDVEQSANLLERFSCNRRSAGLRLVEEAAPYVALMSSST